MNIDAPLSSLTPEQRSTYEATLADLVRMGISEAAARVSAENKARGWGYAGGEVSQSYRREQRQQRATVDGEDSAAVLTPASMIAPERVEWAFPGYLPLAKLALLAGPPGAGKTTAAMGLAATVSVGGRWPDGTRAAAQDVVIWTGEDGIADTLIPRLIAAGADLQRVHLVSELAVDGELRPFDPAHDMPALTRAAMMLPSAGLIVIDPVVMAIKGDSNASADVRRGLRPLVELAERTGAAVLGITHLTKGSQGRDPTERVTGSLAFGAAARVVMVAAKAEGGGRVLMRAKSNVGPDSGGFKYELRQVEIPGGIIASRVVWTGAVEGEAREVLAQAERTDDDRGRSHVEDAEDFLRQLIIDGGGTVERKTALAAGEDHGHYKKRMERAMKRLGVRATSTGFGASRRTLWTLTNGDTSSRTKCNVSHVSDVSDVAIGEHKKDIADMSDISDRSGRGVPVVSNAEDYARASQGY